MADEARTLAGCVLLNGVTCDLESFRVQFFDDWKIEIDGEPEKFTYEFEMGDVKVGIAFIPVKVNEAVEACRMNYEWEGSADAVAAHKAHIKIGIWGCREPLRRYILFTMIASTLLKQEGAIALYRYPTVHRAQDFIDSAEVLKKEDLPVHLWVYVGVHRDENELWNCYTYGMEDFGCEEMEILHTKAPLLEMYGFMQQLVKWLIQSNETLDPEQRLMLNANEGCDIERSEATVFEGLSLKIGYKN